MPQIQFNEINRQDSGITNNTFSERINFLDYEREMNLSGSYIRPEVWINGWLTATLALAGTVHIQAGPDAGTLRDIIPSTAGAAGDILQSTPNTILGTDNVIVVTTDVPFTLKYIPVNRQ